MTPRTLYQVEADLARCAIGYPPGALEAWDCGAFADAVASDVLCATLAACVACRDRGQLAAPPRDASWSLFLRARASLIVADAWTEQWHDEPSWYSPVWGPVELSAATAPFAGGAMVAAVARNAWLAEFATWSERQRKRRAS